MLKVSGPPNPCVSREQASSQVLSHSDLQRLTGACPGLSSTKARRRYKTSVVLHTQQRSKLVHVENLGKRCIGISVSRWGTRASPTTPGAGIMNSEWAGVQHGARI